MNSGDERYRLLVEKLPEAYAYHQVVFDGEGNPVDYIFLEVNKAFENMTGLKRENIIGKRVLEVLPGVKDSSFDWIGIYGRIALTGETIYFKQYSEPLDRHYRVTAYGEGKKYFTTIFQDVTEEKLKEERTRELDCLLNFSLLLRREKENLDRILAETCELLPPAFQYSQHACACITLQDRQFKTSNYRDTPVKIFSPLEFQGEKGGTVEVCYLEFPGPREEKPFLKEEVMLVETVAEHLSRVIEQIQAKKALEESENKLSITLDSIGDGVIATDKEGKITRMNPQAEKLTGWSLEEARGRPLEEVFYIINEKTGEPAPNPVYKVINTGKVEGLANDTTLLARDGTRRQIADSAAPIRDCDGEIFGVIMVFSDITVEYQMREALRRSELRLDAILSNAPGIIYTYEMVDESPRITYVNQNIRDVLGLEPKAVINVPGLWESCIHPDDLDYWKVNSSILREKGEAPYAEFRFKHAGGGYRWLHEEQKVINREEGKLEVVAVCWDITERKQAERLIQARLNMLTFSYYNSLEALLQKTLDEVCDILDSPLGFYHFVDEEKKMLTLKAWSTDTLKYFCKAGDMREMEYSVDKAGVWTDCVRERSPVIHNHYPSLPHRKGMPPGHAEVTRQLVVPIMRQDRIVAILGVGNKPHEYTDHDVQVASYFADIAWTIVEQKQTEEKIRYISFHDSLTGLYNRAFLEEEMKRIDTKRQYPISVIMTDLNGLKLVNDTYGHDKGDEMLKTVAGILEESCRQEDAIARWGGDEFVILLPQTAEEKAEAICKRIQRRCQGVYVGDVPISVALGFAVKWSSGDNMFKVLKKAEDNMYKQKLAESRSTRSNVLNALLKTLQAKSFETEEHTRRMQQVALQIGEKLKLSNSELSRLKLLIILHDIGKINISEEILTKESSLTPEEWEEMKKHPETGFRIARATEEFAHVAEDILSHHENWDGFGYPQGLKGKEIPLLARITAIADAYEVMANGRPYKKALSKEEIVEEFKRCAGTQFDPELVDIFLSLLKGEDNNIRKKG
ncbi:MAG: PAS domain S-box protein [Candidatus Syntrophonatronum acetioxidans]|uniref:PAS domain S-box protein n=1 Tax=Candidatus Syntrophonatronum acetioxidans TaxID=1795816 RepID=A0A424YEQ5_9FIRM|nr:MAG: PAS domain S-box protein [Candidatus Syntrophonatronum acetioxidans]